MIIDAYDCKEILTTGTVKYVTTQKGWWYRFNVQGVFNTFEEALASIGITEEELNERRAKEYDTKGYWYTDIEELNLNDILERYTNFRVQEITMRITTRLRGEIEDIEDEYGE